MGPASPGIASSPQRKPVSGAQPFPALHAQATPLLTAEPAGRAQRTPDSSLCMASVHSFGLKLMFPVKQAFVGRCFASVWQKEVLALWWPIANTVDALGVYPSPPKPPPALSSGLLRLGLQMHFFSAGDTVSPARRAQESQTGTSRFSVLPVCHGGTALHHVLSWRQHPSFQLPVSAEAPRTSLVAPP